MRRAVNKTAKPTAIKVIADEVGKEIALKKGSIKKRINLTKRATDRDPSAAIRIDKKKNPNAASFKGARMTGRLGKRRRGTTLVVQFRTGKTERIETGYVKTVHGGRVAFTRYSDIGARRKYAGPRGGRFRAITGPSVLGVFEGKPGLAGEALREIGVVLEKRTGEEVRFELVKLSRA